MLLPGIKENGGKSYNLELSAFSYQLSALGFGIVGAAIQVAPRPRKGIIPPV
jgi:hypothetical protein